MELPQIEGIGIYNSETKGDSGRETKKRRPTMFEIELPISKGGVSFIDGESMPIEPNMLICAKPNQQRNTRFPFKCFFIHMAVKEGYLLEVLSGLPNFIKINDYEGFKGLFLEIIDCYNTYLKVDELLLQSLVLKLIYEARRCSNDFISSPSGSSFGAVEKAISYIKGNLTEQLSLSEVSSAVNLSPVYFHNLFRTSVGLTLREYIETERIKKAIELLSVTDKTLTEIAFESGFSSQSYFSFVFKRRMKTTPRGYLREINKLYEK